MPETVTLKVEKAFAGLTVREYLSLLFPERPRRAIDALLAAGRVRSRGLPVGARRPVGELPDLSIVGGLEDLPEIFRTGESSGVAILHEDEHVVVLGKPSGIGVVPDRAAGRGSCLGFLVERELEARRRGKPVEQYSRPRIVHRLDRLTSGLVIVARTPEVERELGKLFELGRLGKEYVALLEGQVEAACTTVNCPMAPGRKGRMNADVKGKSAVTRFEVLERYGDATLVLARPRTGRTHQIRVHARALNHPVVADPLYGRGREAPSSRGGRPGRLALHAWRYTLPGTWPGERVFTCPLPADLREALVGRRA